MLLFLRQPENCDEERPEHSPSHLPGCADYISRHNVIAEGFEGAILIETRRLIASGGTNELRPAEGTEQHPRSEGLETC